MPEVLADEHATKIYAGQFAMRMNNGKTYETAKVAAFLGRLAKADTQGQGQGYGTKLRTRGEGKPVKHKPREATLFGQ